MWVLKLCIFYVLDIICRKIDDLFYEEVEVSVEFKNGKLYRTFREIRRERKRVKMPSGSDVRAV